MKPTLVRVLDKDDKPLPGAWVTLGDPNGVLETTGFSSMFPPRDRLVGGFTDEAGEVRLAWGGLESTTDVTAYAPGHAPANDAIRPGKSASAAVLRLGPARPVRATVVLRGTDTPVPGVYVGLPHESDGGPDTISALPAAAERGPIVVGRTGDDGTCVVPHLDASVKTLRVVGEMKLRAEVRLTVVEK